MTTTGRRIAALGIWGLLATFGALQAVAWTMGFAPRHPWQIAEALAAWALMLLLAAAATRRGGRLAEELSESRHAQQATRGEIQQLQMHNAMLESLARSVDVPLAFQSVAQRIGRLVPCDRAGLALLTESAGEFQTYTARVTEEERRSRPRPELVFKSEGTAIGAAVRSLTPLLLHDVETHASEYLDVNVIHSSGFGSALVMPLVSKGRAVGTLNLVSRRKSAFTQAHVNALLPVTEIFAVAYVAQQLQAAVTRHRTVEAMTELTLGVSADINSALQTIIGHCDLLERGYPDPHLQRDLATVVRQAQRISGLLDRMRLATQERLAESAGIAQS